MGRMLKALQQIGVPPDGQEQLRPLTREELAVFGLWHPGKPQEESTRTEAERSRAEESALPAHQPEAETLAPQNVLTAATAPDVMSGVPSACSTAAPQWPAPSECICEFTTMMDEPALEESVPISSELDRLLGDAARSSQRQYRELADALLARVSPGRSAALLFTRAGNREEDDSILADVAAAITRRISGETVAVDADFRNPRLGAILGIESDRTLLDVLLNGLDWRGVVQRTRTARMSLLPCGCSAVVDRPFLQTDRLVHLLDELRSRYDLVLIQAGAVGDAEVGLLARHCEATYLTVQLGCVTRRQVHRAASTLQRCGAALLGGIVIGDRTL